MKPSPVTTCTLLGLPYADISLKETVALLNEAKDAEGCLSVFTPGACVGALARRDSALTSLLRKGDLILPDGAGVLLAARLARLPLRERVAGIDLAEALLRAVPPKTRLFFYGGEKGVAERAAAHVLSKRGDLVIETADGFGEDPIERVEAFRPQLTFVCLGVPKQEAWIVAHKNRLQGVAIGLGGTLDVWSGGVRRAPRALQRTGLEWLWRTLCEPRRLSRLLPLPSYLLSAAKEGRARKRSIKLPRTGIVKSDEKGIPKNGKI